LGQQAWARATMRPCRAVDEKGMADIHVTGVSCGMGAQALERRRRQGFDYIAEEHTSLAKRCEYARDVEVRTDEWFCRGVLWTDIREQEQRQEPAMATVHVHPPLTIHFIAAVNVPAGVPRILHAGEAHGNASSYALAPNPTVWSEERVVHLLYRWRHGRGGERRTVGKRQTDDRRNPRRGITRIDTSRAQFLLNYLCTRTHDVGRQGIAYHQKPVCGEVASGYCHFSLLCRLPNAA